MTRTWMTLTVLAILQVVAIGLAYYFAGATGVVITVAASVVAFGLWRLAVRYPITTWWENITAGFSSIRSRFRIPPRRTGGSTTDNQLRGLAVVIIVGVLLWIGYGYLSEYPILALIVGVLFGLGLFFVSISPLYAQRSAEEFERISSTPGAWKTEQFPLIIFMFRTQNRFYQREKGNTPVDFVGLVQKGEEIILGETPGRRNLTPENPGFWALEEVDDPTLPSKVGPYHRFSLIRLWVAYINLFTDVALIGVRKFYRIRWYPIEKTRYTKSVQKIETGETKTSYEIIPPAPPADPEYSNHIRVAPFDWAVAISNAETKDRFAWAFLIVVNVECMNPWITLNNHENWSRFLTQAVTDAIVRALRRLELKDVIGLGPESSPDSPTSTPVKLGDEGRDQVISAVYAIDKRLKEIIGLELSMSADLLSEEYSGAVQILSAEPVFRTEKDKQAFMQIWRAEQEAEAKIILGKAEATSEALVVEKVAEAVAKNGEAGLAVQRMQSIERAAETGKSTLLFDTGEAKTSNTDKLLAMLVAEREKQQQGEKS